MTEMMYIVSTAIPVTMTALGAGIGQGLIGVKAIQAMDIQPTASSEINRISTIGLSLTETAAIFGLVISIVLSMDTTIPVNYEYAALGRLGISIAIGLSGFIAGIASSLPVQSACMSIARQPFFSNKIIQLMLITQTVIMTPNIFGFVIALFINTQVAHVGNFNEGLKLLAAGLSIGLGSIGPSIGLSMFAQTACLALGVNRKAYTKIVPFTFICEAMIETPAIFSFLISLLILNIHIKTDISIVSGITLIAAACCMGLSTLMTGISAGKTGSAACLHIGNNPEHYSKISNICFVALALIDTFAIYGFIIAIILLYTV